MAGAILAAVRTKQHMLHLCSSLSLRQKELATTQTHRVDDSDLDVIQHGLGEVQGVNVHVGNVKGHSK